MKKIKYFSLVFLFAGSYLLLRPIYFYSKGYIAQYMVSGSFSNDQSFDKYVRSKITETILDLEPIGKIFIPSINMDYTILDGCSQRILAYGPGKMINSYQLRDNQSNIIISGHRDSFFKNLKNIEKDDLIYIEHDNGTSVYRVFNIISNLDPDIPENSKYLDPNHSELLTLVTCYPFNYIGSAPKRYLVLAKLIT